MNDDGKIVKVTIYDNKAIKRNRKKKKEKGEIEGNEGIK